MGWFTKVVSVVAGPAAGAAAGVATGQKPAEAVRESVTAPVAVPVAGAAAAAGAAADVSNKVTALEAKLAEKVGGDKAGKLFLDVRRLIDTADDQVKAELLSSASQFVETLDGSYLNPLVPLLAAELQRVRDLFWDKAQPVPESVIEVMPAEIADVARQCRVAPVSDTNSLSLPAFAIDHLELAKAVTTIDVIFFKDVPGVVSASDRLYWAHELTHARQYRRMGVQEFAKEYLNQVLAGKKPYPLEAEADYAACRYFPDGTPHYFDSCAIALSTGASPV
jgi:hypothetical protein